VGLERDRSRKWQKNGILKTMVNLYWMQHVHLQTYIWLLNEVREALEEVIDVLHEPNIGKSKKPRTYRDCARKEYLNVDKKKRPTAKEIRKSIGQQLRYVHRDLEIIQRMSEKSPLSLLRND